MATNLHDLSMNSNDPKLELSPQEKMSKSYVEQCLDIKKEIYNLLSSVHKDHELRCKAYLDDARKIKDELHPIVKDAKEVSTLIEDYAKNIKKSLKDEVKTFTKQRELEADELNKVLKRMDKLESYIKNERFHDLVREISALEDKFELQAIKLVQDRMKKK